MSDEKWCVVFNLYNKDTGELKRLLICTNKYHNLVEDGIELSYKRKGYDLIKVETVGWVDEIKDVSFDD